MASKRNKVLQRGKVDKKEAAENANIRGITCLNNYNSYCMSSESINFFLNAYFRTITFFLINVAAEIDESDDDFVDNAWGKRSKMDGSNTGADKGMKRI